MTPVYRDARETLAALAGQCRTAQEYTALIWLARYPHATPAPSPTGWPVKRNGHINDGG